MGSRAEGWKEGMKEGRMEGRKEGRNLAFIPVTPGFLTLTKGYIGFVKWYWQIATRSILQMTFGPKVTALGKVYGDCSFTYQSSLMTPNGRIFGAEKYSKTKTNLLKQLISF